MEIKYTLYYSETAKAEAQYFKRLGDKAIIKKINTLLDELEIHPTTGTGRPEILRYELTGLMSRRINGEHRLTYRIEEERHEVHVLSMKGHYK